MPESDKAAPAAEGRRDDSPEAVVLNATELFRGRREVWIEHEGVRYRLRLTRRNKLILQK